MIERIKKYIQSNQSHLARIQSYAPKNDRWVGTVDIAISRFNTIVLYLVNHPLLLDQYRLEIEQCQQAIDNFINNVDRYYRRPFYLQWLSLISIHCVGTFQIPRIKKLLNKLNVL